MDGAHNGRIYDSELGRFLQADPNVQAPDNSQNLNRYSYVLNNPPSYTDPSGFFFKAIGNFVGKYWRQLVAVGIGIVTAGIASGAIWASLSLNSAAAFGVAVAGGALAGYVSTGTLNGALIGAFSAAAYYGVGSYFDDIAQTGGTSGFGKAIASNLRLTKTIAHGMTGGVMSKLNGGRFAHGFISAGTTQAFAKTIGGIGDGERSFGITAARVTSAAIVGGAASELSGGKFANGAVTGAFSRAFNDQLHDGNSSSGNNTLDRHGNPKPPGVAWVIGPNGYWQQADGAAQEVVFGTTYNTSNNINDFVDEHSTSTLSIRVGFIAVLGVDVINTPNRSQLFIGIGLGAGASANATAGIKAGSTNGITTKLSFNGGFGGSARGVFRISEAGVSSAATVGTGVGLSVSTLVGFTFNLPSD